MTAAGLQRAAGDEAALLARLHCRAWRETYRGMLPDAMVDGLGLTEAEAKWRERLAPASGHSVFVAETAAGDAVGFASGCASNEDAAPNAGLLETLYLVKAGQGSGLGRRLLATVADDLAAQGFDEMIVVVHADNPAAKFYAAMGAAELCRRERAFRGHLCPEILWRWPLPLQPAKAPV